jgi:hypothetical protein
MAGPGDSTAAAAGDGHLRASRADREQVIESLKDAYVQERLTKEELDARVGQALASRTYADLAALTADIPGALPGNQPAKVGDRPPMSNARKAAICVAIAVGVPAILAVPTGGIAIAMFIPFYFMALLVAAAQILTTRYEKRWRGQPPPPPGQRGQPEDGPRLGQVGDDPALPGTRPDQTRSDLRTHSSPPDRPCSSGKQARAPRGMRPVPGVA